MIIVKLYGGLGNQMFQYAAGLGLAKGLLRDVFLDLSWFEEAKVNPHIVAIRDYELGIFGIKDRRLSLIEKLSMLISKPATFKEDGLGYQLKFNSLAGNIILDGYWHNPKYFEKQRPVILETFRFPEKISAKNESLLEDIHNSSSVSIHVRRGDYASDKQTNKVHGMASLAYYQKAASLINDSIKNPKFFVFSDDINWCKQNLKLNCPTVFVDNNKGLKSYEDMRLMAACKHNIIANSSFSWWGGWLNQNPDKQVYAPKRWSISSVNGNDILPRKWIKL